MKKQISYISLSLLAILFITLTNSCKKDFDILEGQAKIRYETDTLSFDTVFTAVGSATRYFKVYNEEKQPVLLDFKLTNPNGQFRINVDGIKGNVIKDVEIGAGDSIYVFVEVTVNPNQPLSVSPFIIEEYLLINNGGKDDKVLVKANGQNANYIPKVNGKGTFSYLSCNFNNEVWDDPKPYVIYGILIIDSCNLVIPAGTKIYVHGGLVLSDGSYYNDGQIIVLSKGSIKMKGQLDKKITIQGDRLEEEFKNVAGQWGGIRLFRKSSGNEFNHVELKNSLIGISVDSAAQLKITNSVLKNIGGDALTSNNGNIYGDNLLIYNVGKRALAVGYGGTYEFNHCTFYTNTGQEPSLYMSNFRCQDPPLCESKIFYQSLLNFTMQNSIISGGSDDEISLLPFEKIDLGTTKFDIKMSKNIVRVKDLINTKNYPSFFNYCKDCINIKQGDKLFLALGKEDFRLDTMSIGLNKGSYLSKVPIDILGKERDKNMTDLGCYEF
jgi:hypothetical protein